mgnify:FL=1
MFAQGHAQVDGHLRGKVAAAIKTEECYSVVRFHGASPFALAECINCSFNSSQNADKDIRGRVFELFVPLSIVWRNPGLMCFNDR